MRHYPTQSTNIQLVTKRRIPLYRLADNGSITFWGRKQSSSYLQNFHLNIKHKKGSTNNVADCLSRPPIVAITMILNSCGHDTSDWLLLYKSDLEFSHTYRMILEGNQVLNFDLQDALLCHMGHLCVPWSKRANMVWDTHYSRVAVHLGVEKIVAVLHNYFYWSNLR